ncbi:MAG: helix-turn-helix domain-containing protein [Patescibacteria group bacterium]
MDNQRQQQEERSSPGLMTVPEAARILMCSISTVRRLMMQRRISYYKIRKCVRFSREQIDEYMEKKRIRSIREYV